jgi:hypothetical protein
MISRSRFASFLMLATVAVAACGGTAAVEPTSTSAPDSVASAPAPVAADSGTGTSDNADAAAAGASDVAITGAIEGRVTGFGICGMDPFTGEHWSAAFDNMGPGFDFIEDDLWLLNLDVNQYPGAGTFAATKGSTVGKAEIRLTNGTGTSYDSEPGSGELAIEAGEKSGSIDAMLIDSATGETVAVKGTWSCE